MASYWDDESKVEELKTRWLAGETSNQIADAMQIGRGAVASKLSRIPGLPPRASRKANPTNNKPKHQQHNRVNPVAIARATAEFEGAMARAEVEKTSVEGPRPTLLVRDKHGRMAANDRFTDKHCHWPFTSLSEEGMTEYCGKAVVKGLAYCSGHARRVFQPAELRRRLEDFAHLSDKTPESRVSQEPARELA